MPDNATTIVGNTVHEVSVKEMNGGFLGHVSVAVNRRWQNRQTKEWEERVSYFEVVMRDQIAVNAQKSLPKGTRVIVTGRLEQRSWETNDGSTRTVLELVADDIGPALTWAEATVTRNERQGSPRRSQPDPW